jgi:hypothetical protein
MNYIWHGAKITFRRASEKKEFGKMSEKNGKMFYFTLEMNNFGETKNNGAYQK